MNNQLNMLERFISGKSKNKQQEAAVNADETELAAFRLGTIPITEGLRDEGLAGEFNQSVFFADDEIAFRLDEEDEGMVGDEIRRRELLLKDQYPFRLEGGSLKFCTDNRSPIYEFCLAASQYGTTSGGSANQYQIAFERLTKAAMTMWLGPKSGAFRFGVPGDEHEKHPSKMKEKSDLLRTMIKFPGNEWTWDVSVDAKDIDGYQFVKDLGVDIIAWKKNNDCRRGHLFYLCQCACGKTNWGQKIQEIDDHKLKRYFRPLTYPPYVKVFSTPHHVANENYLGQLAESGESYIFDRIRLVNLFEDNTAIDHAKKEMFNTLDDLIQDAIDKFNS